MDWLQKHFDRVILAVLGVLVLACAGIIVSQSLAFGTNFESRNSTQRKNDTVTPPNTALVKERTEAIEKPAEWGAHDNSLFVSEPYITRGQGEPIPFLQQQSANLFDPVPNAWIKKYNLDFSNQDLLNADTDGDKFSTLEEFNGKTDPTDAKSMPPYVTKLRLQQFIQVPFRLKFSGTPDNGESFTINTLDLKGPTQFLKKGEQIAGTPYKILEYHEKKDKKDDMETDVSELLIENVESGVKITLIYDKPVNDPTVYALFKYLWDNSDIKVKKLDSFSIKPEETVKYKLIDISDNEAVIESAQGKIHVPKL